RVSMTVLCRSKDLLAKPKLGRIDEGAQGAVVFDEVDRISASLDTAAIHQKIKPLTSNAGLCFQGVVPAGDGFKLEKHDLERLDINAEDLPAVVRRYII